MDTASFLRQRDFVGFDFLDDGDALVRGGRYNGMRLSEVFVIDPAFVDSLLKSNSQAVRLAAETIIKDSAIFQDSIRSEVAKGES